jgi:hypothetical protein
VEPFAVLAVVVVAPDHLPPTCSRDQPVVGGISFSTNATKTGTRRKLAHDENWRNGNEADGCVGKRQTVVHTF